MRLQRFFGMMLAAACCFGAEDFWSVREPAKWSSQEIRRMVTDSPWAREAQVRLRSEAIDKFVTIPAARDGVEPAGTPPIVMPEILVRWDSAAPVCEACARGGMDRPLFSCVSKLLYLSSLSDKFITLQEEFYIVTMSNYPAPQGANAPQHSEAANAALERLSGRIQQATLLKRKGRNPLKPDHVAALPAGDKLLLMVFFPRTAALSVADKEILFESNDGTIEISARFDLRKMIYRDALAL
jgi:hypothetical protein